MSQYKQYYTVYKDKDWEMLPQIHQGVMNSWHILKKFLKEEEIVRYSNGLESTIIQTSNQKDQGITCPKEGGKQGRSPKPAHFPKKGRRTRKRTGENQIPQVTGFQKSKKDVMKNFFNMARTLMEFKDKEEQIMTQPHFPKKLLYLQML
ncbi:hypothetical protein O181_088171 [Austropuccinia psidii MF-1]|uniref:Uncharacterized protein n=1 Tax=Austropuccinia psidii MF-1 TaxID=1389203 RepID=A0A9Q3IR13_9BASI|nr:hypothetical protein [Austropuccinia psidii MF-1]